jgi:ribosomal protein S20
MPIIKSAIKRAKQTIKRRERNVSVKRDIKDATKEFIAKPTAKSFSAAQSEIDTAVKKGLIKKNTAARRKANLSKIAKTAGVKFITVAKKAEPKTVTIKPVTKAATTKKPVATKKAITAKPVAKKTVAKKPAVKKAAK